MKLTRYYTRKTIEFAHIRAIRDILSSKFNWGFSSAKYIFNYHGALYEANNIDEADKIIKQNNTPISISVFFMSKGGRTLKIDTQNNRYIFVEVYNRSDPPEKILDEIEQTLCIEHLTETTQINSPSTAFIAHVFNAEGQNYANELARFLSLIGICCYSGRAFSPESVSDKVKTRLAKHDLFFGIVTPHEDNTWITQEIATAAALHKPIFVLKQTGVELKTGILGDHEYLSFDNESVSKSFIPILEGINEILGKSHTVYPWQSDGT